MRESLAPNMSVFNPKNLLKKLKKKKIFFQFFYVFCEEPECFCTVLIIYEHNWSFFGLHKTSGLLKTEKKLLFFHLRKKHHFLHSGSRLLYITKFVIFEISKSWLRLLFSTHVAFIWVELRHCEIKNGLERRLLAQNFWKCPTVRCRDDTLFDLC